MSTLSPAPATASLPVRLALGAACLQQVPSGAPDPPPAHSPDLVRDVVESVSALAGSIVGTGAHLAPAVITAAMQGVTGDLDAESIGEMAGRAIVIEAALAGLVLGAMTAGPVGAVTGGGAGVVAGVATAVLESRGQGGRRIGAAIKEAVDQAVSDNEPSRSRLQDGTRNLVEGAIVGGLAGARVALGVSREGGAGLGAGVVDGARRALPVLLGQCDPAPSQGNPGSTSPLPTSPGSAVSNAPSPGDASSAPSPAGPLKAVLGDLASVLREVLTRVVGTATGLASAAVNCLYGALQGASAPRDSSVGSSEYHSAVLAVEAMLTGAVAGVAILAALPGVGAVGAVAVGSLAGALVGGVLGCFLEAMGDTLGTDVQVSEFVNACLDKALSNASTSQVLQADTVRDATEGAVVGAAAGARAGFVTGFEVGRGVVDGAWGALKRSDG